MNEVATWLAEHLPSDEDLELSHLTELAVALGRERRLWERLVEHDPEERRYVELYRDVHLDVWLICWLNQQDTGFHDHDLSCGAVYVADGELCEDRLILGPAGIGEVSRSWTPDTVFCFDAARIHRMRHPGGAPATSVHLYSPALWRMGYYDFDDDGNFRRASVTYADEMWSQPQESLGHLSV